MDDRLRNELAAWLEFYRELGIEDFYRRPPAPKIEPGNSKLETGNSKLVTELPIPSARPEAPKPEPRAPAHPPQALNLFETPQPARRERETLEQIRADLGDCQRCRLASGRKTIVFGQGNTRAQVVFVGEGPGADEDEQGLPFVGRAGKLLTQMIEAMGLERQDVYICNVVKCRPPENRTPEDDEVSTCSPFLLRQLEVISPKVIVCLGAVAAKTLLRTNRGISQFRGQWLDYRGSKLIATYHPAYLLRNPNAKGEVWKDLQKVMAVLGLQARKGKPA